MKKVNKHGLRINGLREAARSTIDWDARSGGYTEIFYDTSTGDVWTVDQISLGFNSWTKYRNSDIINLGYTTSHMSQQGIADRIYEEINSLSDNPYTEEPVPVEEYMATHKWCL